MKLLQLSIPASICLLAGNGLAMAQTTAASDVAPFVQVITVRVKHSNIGAYEDYVKKIIAAANKVGAPQRALIYQAIMGAPEGTFLAVIPFGKWDDLDTFPSVPTMLNKAYGDIEGAKILKAGVATLESAQTDVYVTLMNLSTNLKRVDPPTAFIQVTRTELNPDLSVSYNQFLAKVKKAQEGTSNWPTIVRHSATVGPFYVTVATRSFDKFSELTPTTDQQSYMRKAYGDEEARQLDETSRRATARREQWILAFRADLSKLTGGMPASSPR